MNYLGTSRSSRGTVAPSAPGTAGSTLCTVIADDGPLADAAVFADHSSGNDSFHHWRTYRVVGNGVTRFHGSQPSLLLVNRGVAVRRSIPLRGVGPD